MSQGKRAISLKRPSLKMPSWLFHSPAEKIGNLRIPCFKVDNSEYLYRPQMVVGLSLFSGPSGGPPDPLRSDDRTYQRSRFSFQEARPSLAHALPRGGWSIGRSLVVD